MAPKALQKRKRQRLGRGRPPKDDQLVVDVACAIEVAHGLGAQRARDLALALIEGHPIRPTKLPRGYRKASAGSKLVGYELSHATFEGAGTTIAQKIRRGDVRARPNVVLALVRLLRAKDEDDCLRAVADLLTSLTPTVAQSHFRRGFEK